jgi:hypothetical protein
MSFNLNIVEKRERRVRRNRRAELLRTVGVGAVGALAAALLIGFGVRFLQALF